MDPETLATEPTVIVSTEPTTPTTTEPVAPEPTTPEPTTPEPAVTTTEVTEPEATEPEVTEPTTDQAAEIAKLREQLAKQEAALKERETFEATIVDERISKEVTPEQKAFLDGFGLTPDKKLEMFNQMKTAGFFATKTEAPKVEIGSPYTKPEARETKQTTPVKPEDKIRNGLSGWFGK